MQRIAINHNRLVIIAYTNAEEGRKLLSSLLPLAQFFAREIRLARLPRAALPLLHALQQRE